MAAKQGNQMRRGRSLQPAATGTRGPVRVALRLLIVSMPLVPWAVAHADTAVPGQNKKPGNTAPQPVEPILARVSPPPPGVMPPPHRPPTEKKK
jgi:hypothetical protein